MPERLASCSLFALVEAASFAVTKKTRFLLRRVDFFGEPVFSSLPHGAAVRTLRTRIRDHGGLGVAGNDNNNDDEVQRLLLEPRGDNGVLIRVSRLPPPVPSLGQPRRRR